MSITFLILFTFFILYFCFGIYTLCKNAQSLKNRMFFTLCMHLSCWALGDAFMAIAPNPNAANCWRMIAAFGWCFTYSIWLDFSILVRHETKQWMSDKKRLMVYIPGFFFYIANLKYKPTEVIIKVNGVWKDIYPINFLEISYILYYAVFVTAGIVIIYKWGKNSESKIKKKQSEIVVITSMISFVVGTLLDTVIPLLGINTFSFGIIALSITLVGIWYAITKYKMMSITSSVANEYVLETVTDPVILIGNDLLIRAVNRIALEMTGYNEQEIKGLPIQSFILETVFNQASIQKLLTIGSVKNIEIGLLTKKCNSIPCLLSGAVMYNDMDEMIGIACVFHDITDRKNAENILMKAHQDLEIKIAERTAELEKNNALLEKEIGERKKAEEELKAREEKYMALMKQSADGILVFDPYTRKVVDLNDQVCAMFEYSQQDISDLLVEKLVQTSKEVIIKNIDAIIKNGHTGVKKVFNLNRANGTIKNIEYSTTLVGYSNKKFILVTFRDITEKLIIEQREQQMVKMESLGTLAGGVAHDFNNILAGIMGYTQLALDNIEDGVYSQENLLEILKLGERAKNLITRILTFSRKNLVEAQNVDMSTIIIETIKMLKTTLAPSIEIKYDFKCDNAYVFSDPVEMQQLIMNLCVNAQLAMQNNGGILEVKLSKVIVNEQNQQQFQRIKLGHYIEMKIIDNGCGMDESIIKRIFEPFFTTRGVQQGTGLGLSVIHGIVVRNEGLITVDSKPNIGSTFTVLLPEVKNDLMEQTSNQNSVSSSTARILFVDDEEPIVTTTQRILQRQGYNVTGVLTGEKALSVFKDNENYFDIVITDQSMPNMTGDALVKQLRSIKPDLPIIICSGYSEELFGECTDSAGVTEFLLKPVSKNQYIGAIEKIMKNRNFSKTTK